MNAQTASSWLGYALDRSRGRIPIQSLGDRVMLLGREAGALATLVAYSGAEAGRKLTILDVDGSVSPEVHGYYRSFDYRSMLYEAFHLQGEDAAHGQLVASAYSSALDLASEEEAILSAAMQTLSDQNDLASPSALYDVVGATEGFRGFYVDKLKGRIGALKHLESTLDETFDQLMAGTALVSFATAPYPQAADLAAGLFLAKILHLLSGPTPHPDAVMITGAHRLFRGLARFQQGGRLMAHLLEARVPLILATPLPALLNERLIQSVEVRVYSSEAWNARRDRQQTAAPAHSYTVCDDRSGIFFGFVPRFVRPRSQGAVPAHRLPGNESHELARTILEEISNFATANRRSIISYLSPQFLAADIGAEVDRLHAAGYLVLEPKDSGGGPRVFAYTVTESGRRLIRELGG